MATIEAQVNQTKSFGHLGNKRSTNEAVELHLVSLNLAKEQAKRIKLEAENQVLVGKLFALRQDFDELHRKSQRKEEQMQSMVENLSTLKKECESLKQIALERTTISSKQKILHIHQVKALEYELIRQRESPENRTHERKSKKEETSMQKEPHAYVTKGIERMPLSQINLGRDRVITLEDALGGKDILQMIEQAGMVKGSSRSLAQQGRRNQGNISSRSSSFVLDKFKLFDKERSAKTLPTSFRDKRGDDFPVSTSRSLVTPEIIQWRTRKNPNPTRSSSSCSSLREGTSTEREFLSRSSSSGLSHKATCSQLVKTKEESNCELPKENLLSSGSSDSGATQDATYSQSLPVKTAEIGGPKAQPSFSESSSNGTSQNATCSEVQNDKTNAIVTEFDSQTISKTNCEFLLSGHDDEERGSFYVFGNKYTDEAFSDDEVSLKEKSVTHPFSIIESPTLTRLMTSRNVDNARSFRQGGRPYGRKVKPSEHRRYSANAA